MSDITAVLLTIGERYAERALDSVRRQSAPPAAVVVVRDVTPFHRALNTGAAQVATPFFVQVDADVILDEICFAALRALVVDGVGLVSGLLRDPIVGRTHGIRLYRTACAARHPIRDSISPDMDFGDDIARDGWVRLFPLRYGGADAARWHTFGDHRPAYTPNYAFCKFRLEGLRSRYRRRDQRARRIFATLCASEHPLATRALIAAAHGMFQREQHDQLVPYDPNPESEWLEGFLAATDGATGEGVVLDLGADPAERFRRAYALGVTCRQRRAAATFAAQLRRLRRADDPATWIALAGLCHGLFQDDYRDAEVDAAYAALVEIL